ncbi:hypothetical protein MKW98_009899 [Papaver atlanticum]|uniref:carotenoid 9,10-dioxygenase n=1 Tax=Papaver atlanticum TaxID=357466 RepID=A0AAD4XMW8_9MAGN|nr:hypothetical protein MKW98_009899 [Papaver atlanticum]
MVRCGRSSPARSSHPANHNQQNTGGSRDGRVLLVDPKPKKGLASQFFDGVEKLIVKLMHGSKQPNQYLSGLFAPVDEETPPQPNLPVKGHLPEGLNGELLMVGPNPKFMPVAGYHWFDGDGMVHGLHIKDGNASYVSRYVRTSRLKQEEYFGGAKFVKIGDLEGLFGLSMASNTSLTYHHGKLLVHGEMDKLYVLKVLEDGDVQTLGVLDYDKQLEHPVTAHPKIDSFTGEMFTFGCHFTPPYCTYRVISKDGFMHDPMPITLSGPTLMHDFAITKNFNFVTGEPVLAFDATKKALFGILPRYSTDEHNIRWFELPSCFIFHNVNAWEDGDEVVLITCRIIKLDLHADPLLGKQNFEVGGNIKGIFNLEPGKFCGDTIFFSREPGMTSEEDDGYLIFFVYDENTGKSVVNVIDAKTMSSDPVAVVELPRRVTFGLHQFFLTEVSF